MSLSLKKFGRRLDTLSAENRVLLNEGVDSIVLSELSAADATEVAELIADAGLTWNGENAADGSVASGEEFDSALEPYRFTVDKPAMEQVAVLFTLVGLGQWLERDLPSIGWKHIQTKQPFNTLARRFLTWDDKSQPKAQEIRRPEPRNLVRESGDPSVPSRIDPWLLDIPLSLMPLGDPVFDEWARYSIQVARRCLASEILADGTIVYAGPPKMKVDGKVDLQVSKDLLFQFQRALRWVYETEHQSEIRHSLLGAELSRHSLAGDITAATLESSIEGAKIAYRLSLSDLSKDSLKAIADVRKAVTEEINKTADTARQLTTAVAGAVFLGLGVVAARVTSNAPPAILIALSFVLAAYIGAIIFASAHYMRLQEDLRSDWKQRYFSFLGVKDYEKLVTAPLAAAKKGFVIVSYIAGFISAAMVIGVIILVMFDGGPPAQNIVPAAGTVAPAAASSNSSAPSS
ncbi:hypothetical protein [Mariluticola halotolerans]|uniref:hypothetical protein n=1 Tax=Mariluticola halotolerans TaxID=2909283 RepID=UPI0026E11918|nr:hypothetical protein [Mariluticola halotolerans]UJQ94137.1 hypothetical protein L1P08_14430 [Mariluticola halotolerans]